MSDFFANQKRQRWILLSCVIIVLPLILSLIYVLSPLWATHRLMSAFENQDTLELKKQIPSKLLLHLIPNPHPEQKWQGAGRIYLQHIWPKLYAGIDRDAWLAVQVQMLHQDDIHSDDHGYYGQDFNQYRLDIGRHQKQIRIEFKRSDMIHWRIQRICYPNPQPDWVENRCPSSKR